MAPDRRYEMNPEGYTWAEWFYETYWRSANACQIEGMLQDWRDGVDPGDWRMIWAHALNNLYTNYGSND